MCATCPNIAVVSVSDRPGLASVVAGWLWDAFWRDSGHSFEETMSAVQRSIEAEQMPQTFVLLEDERAIGTASLIAHDLKERPDLTPWLAGMYVEPDSRGRGLASYLIAAVEQHARSMRIATLWLYTDTAERVYAKAGWEPVGSIQHSNRPFMLMRRDLLAGA